MWVLESDIGAPRVPGDVISRPRLLALLDRGTPLTLLRGACGAGKTVLLREWVQAQTCRILWITADPEAADSRSLAHAIVRRLQPPNGPLRGVAGDTAWPAAHRALREAGEAVTIVIDDAATLRDDALLALCEMLVAVPSVRVIAAANQRSMLDDEGVGLLVDRLVIGPLQLMFDEEEIGRALSVDAEHARHVCASTSGFPAVIHALAKRGVRGTESLVDDAAEAVEQYMAMRVARAGYDPAILATLTKVGFAEEVDEALACELSGDPDAVRLLSEAEHYGFGTWSRRDGTAVFRFVPFARKLLRREVERSFAAELPRMRRAVVDSALRRGKPVLALRVATEDPTDLETARRVVMMSWHRLIRRGTAVRATLGAIPLSRLRDEPLLVTLLAVCDYAVRVRRARAVQLFRIAVSAANASGHTSDTSPTDRLFTGVAESVALRMLGMHDRAAVVALRALRVLTDTPEDEIEDFANQAPLLCAQLGTSLYYGGNQRQAFECFTFGAAVAAGGEQELGVTNLAMLSGIHALNGDIPDALHYVRVIRDAKWSRRYLDGYEGTFYRVAEAIIALEAADVARAEGHVAVFEPHHATSEHWVTMVSVEALVALRRGQAARGAAHLESVVRGRGREGHSGAARQSLSRTRALLQLALGNAQVAKGVLYEDAPDQGFETIVERARLGLIENRPRDTLRILGQMPAASTTSRVRAAAAALRTAALVRTGGPAAARHEAQGLGALLIDRELRFPLALLPPADAAAVCQLLRAETGFAFEPVESVLPDSVGALPLSARELVVLRSLTTGKPLTVVADELGVSLNTVKTQVKSVYRKLGVAGRDEAVTVAVARQLLSDPV